MWLWHDLLAAAEGMAGSGSVGDASQDALEPPRRSRRDRLVEGLARLGKRGGIPLAVRHTAANVHDSRMLEAMLVAVSPIRRPRGRPGRPRKRPEKLHADKG
jgi:hypothetical protein